MTTFPSGAVDAASRGFAPEASGARNTVALQAAVDNGGTIVVSRPGVYDMAGTVFLGSHTRLVFGAGIQLRKTATPKPFTHVLLNRGALTRTWDEDIVVEGLHVLVNGVDVRDFVVYGLHGQIAFHYVRDLRIERFRCPDLGKAQYGIHVCTFEDVLVDDVIISGEKDGVHLGRGRRFTIRNGVFATYDDAVALNGHDYAVGNPEMGWIEDGVVENCHDLQDDRDPVGYFCRILAGAWVDWREGMEVQQSDTVVSQGRLYRVQAQPDGALYTSHTRPTHHQGTVVLDGIPWGMVQEDVTYSAGVRNVVFRDIFLRKPRIGFSVHFDNDRYSRSYYPGAEPPHQEQLLLDGVRTLHDEPVPLLSIGTPIDVVSLSNTSLRAGNIRFHSNSPVRPTRRTFVALHGCTFRHTGEMELVSNSAPGRRILLQTTGSIEAGEGFRARVEAGEGNVEIRSDLTGLSDL